MSFSLVSTCRKFTRTRWHTVVRWCVRVSTHCKHLIHIYTFIGVIFNCCLLIVLQHPLLSLSVCITLNGLLVGNCLICLFHIFRLFFGNLCTLKAFVDYLLAIVSLHHIVTHCFVKSVWADTLEVIKVLPCGATMQLVQWFTFLRSDRARQVHSTLLPK